MACRLASLVVLCTLAQVQLSHAQDRTVQVELATCPDASVDEVLRILHIELGERVSSSPNALAVTSVTVSCEGVNARIVASAAGRGVEKTMSLESVDAAARARLLALGIAELTLEAERIVPPTAPAPAPAAPPPLPPPGARPLPPVARLRFALSLAAISRLSIAGRALLYGARLQGETLGGAWLSWLLAAEYTQSERNIPLGALRWRSGGALLAARFSRRWASARAFADVGLIGSLHQLRGLPSKGSSGRGASFAALDAGPRLALGAELAFARHGLAALDLEGIRNLRGLEVKSEGERSTTLGPWLFGASLGMGARW